MAGPALGLALPEISACPRCASLDIRAASVADGVFAGGGELLLYICHQCHFRGQPVLFDSTQDWEEFAASLGGQTLAEDKDEAVPAEMRSVLEMEAPRPSRASAVVVGGIGVALLAVCGLLVLGAWLALLGDRIGMAQSGLGAATFYQTAIGLLGLGLGIVFLRAGRRMWRGPSRQ